MRRILESTVLGTIRRAGFELQRNSVLWKHEPKFLTLMEKVRTRTLVADDRCFMLWQLAHDAAALSGDFAEVGVYRGGTATLLADAARGRALHLFDSFQGLPDGDPDWDRLHKGDMGDTSVESVKRFMSGYESLEFHVGRFPDTARGLENSSYALVHLDCDLYGSIRSGLEYFYPRLVTGGVIVVDDFDYDQCPGVRRALEEFLHDKPERPIVTRRYQCAIFKKHRVLA